MLYAIWGGIVFAIARPHFDLLALRRPQSWPRALGLAAGAIVAIYICEAVVSIIPLPQSPGKEQGLTPTHWESAHAGAFAANLVLFAVVAPFVEELTFRGLGQSLLMFLGRWQSIIIVGFAFGFAHGLLEALLVLVPFGIALAWVRDRTDSVYPGNDRPRSLQRDRARAGGERDSRARCGRCTARARVRAAARPRLRPP